MDKQTKFRSAFASAQIKGVTVSTLLASISFYQKVLAKENDDCLSAFNHQVSLNSANKIITESNRKKKFYF